VIRQNWHLLPENQIIEVLGWTEDKYRFTLKEDDFLDIKLGLPKPRCSQLLFSAPTAEQRARAAQIREIVEETFGASIHERGEDLFQFIQELGNQRSQRLRSGSARCSAGEIELTEGWTTIELAVLGGSAQPESFEIAVTEVTACSIRPAGGTAFFQQLTLTIFAVSSPNYWSRFGTAPSVERSPNDGQKARNACNIGTQPVRPTVYGVNAPL
jgi:hypothetical protein